MEDKDLVTIIEDLQSSERTVQDRIKIQERLLDVNLANLDGYLVEQLDKTNFILKHAKENKEEFKVTMWSHQGKVIFDGIPKSMMKHLDNFCHEEKIRYPVTVLSVILKQTYQPKQDLKSNAEVSKMIYQAANIKQENPLK